MYTENTRIPTADLKWCGKISCLSRNICN